MFRLFFLLLVIHTQILSAQQRIRDYGISPGILNTGEYNAITDVKGVSVGHTTLIQGDSICTGVTAILPHIENVFQKKVPAGIYVGNGFGKLAGSTQVTELGVLETPVVLTNTLSVGDAIKSVVSYTLDLPGNKSVRSVNAVVGETNDGYLNDIRGMHVKEDHIYSAIENAKSGPVPEGSVGAGTGTIAFGFKGGIGTSSRQLQESMGGFTIGVLVQANFGGVLNIAGAPVGEELKSHAYRAAINKNGDGSCMIVVATDAPLSARNLRRLAKRAMLGLARTGGFASNGSGDYVIAFSTYEDNFVKYASEKSTRQVTDLHNNKVSPLFLATVEATEEAILNALVAAKVPKGFEQKGIEEIPMEKVLQILKRHNLIDDEEKNED